MRDKCEFQQSLTRVQRCKECIKLVNTVIDLELCRCGTLDCENIAALQNSGPLLLRKSNISIQALLQSQFAGFKRMTGQGELPDNQSLGVNRGNPHIRFSFQCIKRHLDDTVLIGFQIIQSNGTFF